VPDAEQRLCDVLRWAGIQWDEGPEVGGPYGPYKQSERTKLYQQHAQRLLDNKAAFRCFCSSTAPSPVDPDTSLLASAVGGCQSDCQTIPQDESARRATTERHAVRFAKPTKAPSWSDVVYGKVSLESKKALPQRAAVEGVILLKGDGTPTYHLANVIDDHHMQITHVIRGTEWMSSTPLHVALYNAFGWAPPTFAHVGLLTDKDQAKLSKRNFDTDIAALKTKHGILPESLANFLALLGWRNPTRDDVLDMNKLIELFDLKFTKGNSIVSFEKLWYLQKHHARIIIERAAQSSDQDASFENLVDMIESAARNAYPDSLETLKDRDFKSYARSILLIDDKTYETPSSYVERNAYFFTLLPAPSPAPDTAITLSELRDAVLEIMQSCSTDVTRWRGTDTKALKSLIDASTVEYAEAIETYCRKMAAGDEDQELVIKKWRKAIHIYIRYKLCGQMPGPNSAQVMAVMGREEMKARFECRQVG
jgi:glutamyl-tRNA synthetase